MFSLLQSHLAILAYKELTFWYQNQCQLLNLKGQYLGWLVQGEHYRNIFKTRINIIAHSVIPNMANFFLASRNPNIPKINPNKATKNAPNKITIEIPGIGKPKANTINIKLITPKIREMIAFFETYSICLV